MIYLNDLFYNYLRYNIHLIIINRVSFYFKMYNVVDLTNLNFNMILIVLHYNF